MGSRIFYGIKYGSFVVAWILLIIAIRKLLRGRIFWCIFWLILGWLFIWARFIEPYRVVVQETMINTWFTGNVVLIADTHLWVLKWQSYLQKIVEKINTLHDVQAVLIAWDLTFEPVDHSREALEELFSPLADSKFPVIAVLWNHDVWVPWPELKKPLIQALNAHWVIYLENDRYQLWNLRVVWLWPHLRGTDDISLLDEMSVDDNVIVLTHNPDTTLNYDNYHADVTLVWHTHCGQVRFPWLPFLYTRAIPVVWDFDCWLYDDSLNKIFITSWLGESRLPIRFFNPPTIDLIRFR